MTAAAPYLHTYVFEFHFADGGSPHYQRFEIESHDTKADMLPVAKNEAHFFALTRFAPGELVAVDFYR